MVWESMAELGKAYGLGIAVGLLLGAMVAMFNSWKA